MSDTEISIQNARQLAAMDPSLFDAFERKKKHNQQTANTSTKDDNKGLDKRLRNLAIATVDRLKENRQMMDMLPDLILLKRFYIASILSPKDLYRTEVRFTCEHSDSSLAAALTEYVQNYFDATNLNSQLNEILEDALFDHGAFIRAVLPEGVIRNMSASLLERLNKHRTGKETKQKISLESLYEQSSAHLTGGFFLGVTASNMFTMVDDFRLLAAPSVAETAHSKDVYANIASSVGLESADLLTLVSDNIETDLDGKALEIRLSLESTIPLHPPGDPSNHMGYYVLLDGKNRPLSSRTDTYRTADDIKTKLSSALREDNSAVANAFNGISVAELKRQETDFNPDTLLEMFDKSLKSELKSVLDKTPLGAAVEVEYSEQVKRLIFNELLDGHKPKMLYLPKEMVSYFAFDYDDYGMGKSLLEATKVYGNMRVMLTFVDLIGAVRSAIPETLLNITIDEDEIDKPAYIEMVVEEYLNSSFRELPLNSFSPSDMMRGLSAMGIRVDVQDNEKWTANKVTVERNTQNYQPVDRDLSDDLKRRHYAGFGFSPETVDSAMAGELATVFHSRNALNSKAILEQQMRFEEMLSEDTQRRLRLSGSAVNEMYAIAEKELSKREREERAEDLAEEEERLKGTSEESDNKDKQTPKEEDVREVVQRRKERDKVIALAVDEAIRGIKARLPDPDLSAYRSAAEAYREYADFVDTVIEAYVTDDMETMYRNAGWDRPIDEIRVMLTGSIKREWLKEQNLLPVLDHLLDTSKESEFLPNIKSHIKDLAAFMKRVRGAYDKAEQTLTTKDAEPPTPEGPAEDGSGGDDTTDAAPADTEEPADTPASGDDDPFAGFDDSAFNFKLKE